ncbi:hypothetical protein BC938DRAFT_473360 [Jimgerdemannia flammicorona]|uniref:Formin GTPase-binding domain-containing protein n=1 Tax=Jimgerdemannia flammicorona TaxID=994334 RepID=A0A433Q444_9FUNG|nr:hypothetical protein BC938DRAFT_473360 [Jimgerdemannia flammicorona]
MDLFGLGKKPSRRTPNGDQSQYANQSGSSHSSHQAGFPRSPTLPPRNLSPPPRGDSANALYNSSNQYPGNYDRGSFHSISSISDEYSPETRTPSDAASLRSSRSSTGTNTFSSITLPSDYGDPSVPNNSAMQRPSDREVEELFDKMLNRRGMVDPKARAQMGAFPIEKKWLMVSSDILVLGPGGVADKNTPEYYIRQFMDTDLRNVTPKLSAHLAVSLRTMPLRVGPVWMWTDGTGMLN